MRHARSKAFTLIDLLVVVGIIALLVAILLPALARARNKAKQTMCMANQRSLMYALVVYSQDNGDFLPPVDWQPTITLTAGGTKQYTNLHWYSTELAGKYVNSALNENLAAPDSLTDTGNSVSSKLFFCPSMPNLPSFSAGKKYYQADLGIGYNGLRFEGGQAQNGNRMYTTDVINLQPDGYPVYRLPQFTRPSATIMLMDVISGGNGTTNYKFFQYYQNDPLMYGSKLGAPGSPSYRHTRQCNVCFADGHVESFTSNQDDPTNMSDTTSTTHKNVGIDAAYLAKQVSHRAVW